jgi:hypothetical protein
MSWMTDPAEEQTSHSEEDHGFGDVEALLVIADQPALCISSRLAFPTTSALRSYCLDKSEWSPEGDYFSEGDRLLMFKPEVHTAEWSVT